MEPPDQQPPAVPPPAVPPPPEPVAAPVAAPPGKGRLIVIGGMVAVAAIVVLAAMNRTERKDAGKPAAGGACGAMVDEPPTGGAQHQAGRIDYDAAPPTSGAHNPSPLQAQRRLVPRDTAPELAVERAVHNLEHGYVVVWYDSGAAAADVAALTAALQQAAEPKVLAVEWDRGDFEDDAHFVLTAWGHRQACTAVTRDVLTAFYDQHGGTNGDAPEKNAF